MISDLQLIVIDAVLFSLLISLMSISMIEATSILTVNNGVDQQINRATECKIDCWNQWWLFCLIDVMTSSAIDGIKRSNVCGDGYRIDGAVLKSYPYSKSQSYFPYEDCYMTFKVEWMDEFKFDGICFFFSRIGSSVGSSNSYTDFISRFEWHSWWSELSWFSSILPIRLHDSKGQTR